MSLEDVIRSLRDLATTAKPADVMRLMKEEELVMKEEELGAWRVKAIQDGEALAAVIAAAVEGYDPRSAFYAMAKIERVIMEEVAATVTTASLDALAAAYLQVAAEIAENARRVAREKDQL